MTPPARGGAARGGGGAPGLLYYMYSMYSTLQQLAAARRGRFRLVCFLPSDWNTRTLAVCFCKAGDCCGLDQMHVPFSKRVTGSTTTCIYSLIDLYSALELCTIQEEWHYQSETQELGTR